MSFEHWNKFLTDTIAELNKDQAHGDHSKALKHKDSDKDGRNKAKQKANKKSEIITIDT